MGITTIDLLVLRTLVNDAGAGCRSPEHLAKYAKFTMAEGRLVVCEQPLCGALDKH